MNVSPIVNHKKKGVFFFVRQLDYKKLSDSYPHPQPYSYLTV